MKFSRNSNDGAATSWKIFENHPFKKESQGEVAESTSLHAEAILEGQLEMLYRRVEIEKQDFRKAELKRDYLVHKCSRECDP